LLLCIDDLRSELHCFGIDYIYSPHIDELAKQSVSFTRHDVNAPSCGPSRYTLLTDQYGLANKDALFQRADKYVKDATLVNPSMPQ
jgi:iduronate 2-sulfatase